MNDPRYPRADAVPAADQSRDGAAATAAHNGRHRPPVPAVVALRPLASGLPFGFFGLVAAAAITGVDAYGFLPKSAAVAVGLLLFPTAVLQVIGGISAIAGRDVIAASLLLTFAGVWLGTGLIFVIDPPEGELVLAMWYFCLGPVILGLISSATAKLALAMVPTIGFPTFMLTGAWLIAGGATLGKAVGILSFVLALAALYVAVALLLEDARRRTVLPTLRRGPMRRALTDDFDSQLEDLQHEAGVRRYL